jgi:hypothetical protein
LSDGEPNNAKNGTSGARGSYQKNGASGARHPARETRAPQDAQKGLWGSRPGCQPEIQNSKFKIQNSFELP